MGTGFDCLTTWVFETLDCGIIYDLTYDLEAECDPDLQIEDYFCPYFEDVGIFEGITSGRTVVAAAFLLDGELPVEEYFFDIYVDQHPCLCASCPRSCVSCCYDDEEYDYIGEPI